MIVFTQNINSDLLPGTIRLTVWSALGAKAAPRLNLEILAMAPSGIFFYHWSAPAGRKNPGKSQYARCGPAPETNL